MDRKKALENAKKIMDFLAGEGLTFQEADEAIRMVKAVFRGLQNAAVEKQKETSLADITGAADISLDQGILDIKA